MEDLRVTHMHLGAITSDGDRFIFRAPDECLIRAIHVTNGTAVGDADNTMTFTVTNLEGDGAGTDTVAALTTNVAGALVADVPKALTLSTTAANLELSSGDILQMDVNVSVSGTAVTDAEFAVTVTSSPGFGTGI